MNNLNIPKTGNDQLDRDLKALFEALDSARLEQIKHTISDSTISLAKLREAISDNVLKLILILTDPIGSSVLLDGIETDAKPIIQRARDLAQEHFGQLRSYPAVVEVLKEAITSQAKAREEEKLKLNTISGIGYFPTYTGKPPKLIPGIRLGFRDDRGKLLLDSVLDWDDLLYVSKALADIAADELEAATMLNKLEMLDLDDEFRRKLGGHIQELTGHVERLRQLTTRYNIPLTIQ